MMAYILLKSSRKYRFFEGFCEIGSSGWRAVAKWVLSLSRSIGWSRKLPMNRRTPQKPSKSQNVNDAKMGFREQWNGKAG